MNSRTRTGCECTYTRKLHKGIVQRQFVYMYICTHKSMICFSQNALHAWSCDEPSGWLWLVLFLPVSYYFTMFYIKKSIAPNVKDNLWPQCLSTPTKYHRQHESCFLPVILCMWERGSWLYKSITEVCSRNLTAHLIWSTQRSRACRLAKSFTEKVCPVLSCWDKQCP